MSNPFKAIGKVFKSVVKVVSSVVKGAFKIIKKIAPYVLMAAAVYFGGVALAGGFSSAGAGMTASSIGAGTAAGGATGAGLAGAAGYGGMTTAAGAGALGTAASSTGAVFSSSLLSNPVFSAINTVTTGLSSGAGTVMNVAKSVGGFIKNNAELVKIGAGALQGAQEQKLYETGLAENARQFDESLDQRKDENNFQGSLYGTDREGNSAYTPQDQAYTPTGGNGGTPDDENTRMDQNHAKSLSNQELMDFYNQAYYQSMQPQTQQA